MPEAPFPGRRGPVLKASLVLLACLWLGPFAPAQVSPDSLSTPCLPASAVALTPPPVAQPGDSIRLEVRVAPPYAEADTLRLELDGRSLAVPLVGGQGHLWHVVGAADVLSVQLGTESLTVPLVVVRFPWWLSIIPPLVAILLALVFREVVVSLVVGIFSGAAILAVYQTGTWTGIGRGFLAVVDEYVLPALSDSDHMAIVIFSMLIGGMVALVSQNGGMQGIVNGIARYAQTARSGQLATWLLGMVIFFDDYANTLVVGNTMRPVTDRLRISREKLSYLVDSTAAPVAALAFITTWIGAELGYIEDGIAGLAGFPAGQSPYAIFLSSLAYSFYPLLTLAFMLMLILSGRDYGPMLTAERRARQTGAVSRQAAAGDATAEMKQFEPVPGHVPRAYRAVLPILTLVLGVLTGLLYTGWEAGNWSASELGWGTKLSQTIGGADSYAALLWASLAATTLALLLTVGGRILSLTQAVEAMTQGFKAMLGAILILTLAWALQGVTQDMHTAGFLTQLLGDAIAPGWLPVLTFVLAALVSFSTGSSWGAMAILYPLLIPLSWEVSRRSGLPVADALAILHHVVASVLAGAVLGDHCSPISDTTILSSLASACDHIDHVRTQLPYALTVGAVAVVAGAIPVGFGMSAWLGYPLALGLLYGIIRWQGKTVPPAPGA